MMSASHTWALTHGPHKRIAVGPMGHTPTRHVATVAMTLFSHYNEHPLLTLQDLDNVKPILTTVKKSNGSEIK